jgi:hypothetical protein
LASSAPEAASIRLVLNLFRERGWRDEASAALALVQAVFADASVLDTAETLAQALPDEFLVANGIGPDDVSAALDSRTARLQGYAAGARALQLPALIQMSQIDSFAQVSTVSATAVASFANPLDLPEDTVERIIAKVIGEPYLVKDWGGESDDLYSGQVRLGGREVRSSFLLKGSGLRGPLKPKNLGHNGDQITRMMAQPAELFIVQHVGRVEPSVVKQLRDAVLARRSEGNGTAAGSVWDGVDTARLGVAYGFLDTSTGRLRPGQLEA